MANAKKPTFAIVTEGTKLTTLIKSIGVRGKKLDADIHTAAVSALWHGYQHKSTGYAENLLSAMPASARKNALKAWLLDMGCFMLKEDNKTLGIDKERHAKGFDEANAIATPYWEYNKEPEVLTQVDAMALVNSLIKRLTKAKENGQLDAVGLDVLAKVTSVAPAFELQGANSGAAEVPM